MVPFVGHGISFLLVQSCWCVYLEIVVDSQGKDFQAATVSCHAECSVAQEVALDTYVACD